VTGSVLLVVQLEHNLPRNEREMRAVEKELSDIEVRKILPQGGSHNTVSVMVSVTMFVAVSVSVFDSE